jgi:hypothetical protein
VATSLADPPAAPGGQQAGRPPSIRQAEGADAAQERRCARCGAPMRPEQDWCLACGTGAPGSLQAHSSSWRVPAAVLAAVALLVAGAAAAAYAALSKSSARPRAVTALARTPAQPPATTALPPTSAATPPPAIPKLGSPVPKNHVPLVPSTTPSLGAATKAPRTTTIPAATTPAATGTTTQPSAGATKPAVKQPVAIVLDTNAASTYNPYAYPAGNFGDPSLAIDGEPATAWTASVDPAVAPKMAEGLLLDLKSGQKLGALALTTATPGMTVQIYGTTAATAPSSITDPAWVHLSPPLVAKKRTTRITLSQPKQAFHFVTLWISRAPDSAVGTPAAPGHVRVNELEIFAP